MSSKDDIYVFVDKNMRKDENILTVDFFFNSDVTVDDAVKEVDNIISLLDDKDDYELRAHRPTIYTVSPFVKKEE